MAFSILFKNRNTFFFPPLFHCRHQTEWTPLQMCSELFQALKQEWVAIPVQVIHNLIQFMPKRFWTVIDSQEGHTSYWCACPSATKYKVTGLFLRQLWPEWTKKWNLWNLMFCWIFEHQFNSKTKQIIRCFFVCFFEHTVCTSSPTNYQQQSLIVNWK